MKTFFTGVGLGVVGGLLFAPKRGELTRAELREWSNRAMDAALDTIAQAKRERVTKKSPASETSTSTRERSEDVVELLNTATRDALIAVHGIGQVLADRLIENRPFQRAYEVVEKGLLPESTFLELRRQLLNKSA
jgi:gas vesicle protein